MDNLQRPLVYEALHSAAKKANASGGPIAVSKFFAEGLVDQEVDEDLVFMRLTACVRAEGLAEPTIPYVVALRVGLKGLNLSKDRTALITDMLTQISADMCHELVIRAMQTSRHIAVALGSEVDISATSKDANDGEWLTLDAALPVGSFLH